MLCVWGTHSASGLGRGAKFLGLALDHKFVFTYQEQEHCSQLFTEAELPLDPKSRINDKQSHIVCFRGQCKERYFAFATTEFCCLQRIPCISSNTPCSLLFLPPSCASCSYWPSLIMSQGKKQEQSISRLNPWHHGGKSDVGIGILGSCMKPRGTGVISDSIWTLLSSLELDVKHLLRGCVLEGKKSFSCSTFLPPYCISKLTPFPPLFSSAFSPLLIFRKIWNAKSCSTKKMAIEERLAGIGVQLLGDLSVGSHPFLQR